VPKTRWKYDDGPIDLRTAAPRWTEAVETLTSQIDTLRTNSTIANGYTKFAMSVLRSKINNGLAPDVPSLSLEDAAEAARTLVFQGYIQGRADAPEVREMRGLLEFTDDVFETLNEAAPVYITEEMMRLADIAVDSLPYDVNLTPQSLLEPNMWLYFEQGIPIHTQTGDTQVLKAVIVRSAAHVDETVPGFDLVYMSDMLDDRDTTGDGAAWPTTGGLGQRLFPSHVTGLKFGDGTHWRRPDELDIPDEFVERAIADISARDDIEIALDFKTVWKSALDAIRTERFIVTILLMLTQKEVRVVEGQNRSVLRRFARVRKQPLDSSRRPRIVVLRRREYVGAGEGEEVALDRSHRWWRRGHWRQYKPGKWTYVTGHACGPEDKPFLPKNNAYTWER